MVYILRVVCYVLPMTRSTRLWTVEALSAIDGTSACFDYLHNQEPKL